MRKITIQFLKSYLNSQMTDKSLNSAIMDFLRDYDLEAYEDLPPEFINDYDFHIPKTIGKSLDVALNIGQDIEQGYRALEEMDLIENVGFEFISVDGIQIKSMSPEHLKKVYEDFEWKAKTCPVLHFLNYNLYNLDGTFRLDWFLPIPINASKLSNTKEGEIQQNILRYFEKHFVAEAQLTWWSILSQPDIRGVEFLYDQIIFPEVYYNAFGLALDYKLIDQKKD